MNGEEFIFGAAIAAFVIWLTVRVVRRERWAIWTAVALSIMAVMFGAITAVDSYFAARQ